MIRSAPPVVSATPATTVPRVTHVGRGICAASPIGRRSEELGGAG